MATRVQQFPFGGPGGGGGLDNVVEDLTPQLGGTLDMNGNNILAADAAGAAVLDLASTATVPSLCPTKGDLTKGVGNGSGNSLALISAGTQCLRLAGVASGVNSYTFSSAVAGLPGRMIAQGPDTNIDTYLASKGLGVIGFHPGNGTRELFIDTDGLKAELSTGPAMLNSTPLTTAVLRPNRVNNTGLGTNSTGSFAAMIHNGAEVFRFNSAGNLSLANVNTVSGASLLNEVPTGTNPSVAVTGSVLGSGLGGTTPDVSLIRSSIETLRVDASAVADDIRLMLFDVTAATLKRVSRGAVDSGGTGFRSLNVAN